MNDTKTQAEINKNSDQDPTIEKSKASSHVLIQNNLPQHKLGAQDSAPKPTTSNQKEKWSFLKSDLTSALNYWTELEKKAPQKTPEEEQLEKVRSLISNLKERLAEF